MANVTEFEVVVVFDFLLFFFFFFFFRHKKCQIRIWRLQQQPSTEYIPRFTCDDATSCVLHPTLLIANTEWLPFVTEMSLHRGLLLLLLLLLIPLQSGRCCRGTTITRCYVFSAAAAGRIRKQMLCAPAAAARFAHKLPFTQTCLWRL
jgi:hypothetical protein